VALGALFTGRYPARIPLCSQPHFARAEAATPAPWCLGIPEGVPTLAQVLGYYGYHSAFVSTVAPEHASLTRGFDSVVVPPDATSPHAWPWLRAQAEAWWTANGGGPRLLVVQTELDLATLKPLLLSTDEGALAYAWEQERVARLSPDDPHRYKLPYGGGLIAAAPVGAAYDTLAAEAGRSVGGLLGGLADDTLPSGTPRARWVAVTSLHGVSLGELTGTLHPEQLVPGTASLLLERTLHVPLDLLGPAHAGAATADPVQLVDLLPTFLGLAHARAPAEISGRALLAPAAPVDAVAYAEFGDMLAVRRGPDLLSFRAENHGTSSISPDLTAALTGPDAGAHHEYFLLHDVVADPLQRVDLARTEPARLEPMRELLVGMRIGPAAPAEPALSVQNVEALRKIRASGYW
jgi:arylsulfatase A-like enzyme